MRLKNCQAGIMTSLRMLPVVPDLARPAETLELSVRDAVLWVSSPSGIQVSWIRLGLGSKVLDGRTGEYEGRGLLGCSEGAGVLGDEPSNSVDSTCTAKPLVESMDIRGRPVVVVSLRSRYLRTSMRLSK